MAIHGNVCERARSKVSYALDGELSEFDRKALARHLARCDECRWFAESTQFITTVLRDEALIPFSCRRVTLPRASRVAARRLGPLIAALPVVTAFVAGAAVWQFRPVDHGTSYSTVATQTVPPELRLKVKAVQEPVNRIRLPIGQRSARDEFQPPVVKSRIIPVR